MQSIPIDRATCLPGPGGSTVTSQATTFVSHVACSISLGMRLNCGGCRQATLLSPWCVPAHYRALAGGSPGMLSAGGWPVTRRHPPTQSRQTRLPVQAHLCGDTKAPTQMATLWATLWATSWAKSRARPKPLPTLHTIG